MANMSSESEVKMLPEAMDVMGESKETRTIALEAPMEEEEGRGENLEIKMPSSTQKETLQQVEALMESEKAELEQEVVEIMTEMQVETSTEEEGGEKKREMKMQQVEALMESSKAEPEQEAVEIRMEMEGGKKNAK
jgi:hypothetical protein